MELIQQNADHINVYIYGENRVWAKLAQWMSLVCKPWIYDMQVTQVSKTSFQYFGDQTSEVSSTSFMRFANTFLACIRTIFKLHMHRKEFYITSIEIALRCLSLNPHIEATTYLQDINKFSSYINMKRKSLVTQFIHTTKVHYSLVSK